MSFIMNLINKIIEAFNNLLKEMGIWEAVTGLFR